MRAMQQQFTTALDSWTRQNIDLQAELVQGRQQGASERAALRQEVRTARVTEGGSRCGHTALKARRLLGCSRRVARLECSVLGLRWRSGATTPEADWKLRKQERRSQTPRSWRKEIGQHRKQLYWMMLMTCKGAALNIVFLASDSKGLEAWRQLTEKYEPKMRTRSAARMMPILSFSLQAETTERITALEREIATHERDGGKVLDDEIKIGTFLLRLPESQLKTHLLMRVDTKWTDFRSDFCCDLSSNLHGSDTDNFDGRWSHEQRNTKQGWQGSER